jgi:eukaryotic-like serine/threonine-protein kinase
LKTLPLFEEDRPVVGNPTVLELLEEMLDAGRTPEEVCRDCPDLLPKVRERWQAFCAVDARVVALLPGLRTNRVAVESAPPDAELPEVPGYEVERVLGRGGMGIVYLARHLALKRTVAIKMLAGGGSNPGERARLRAEAEAVARLQHPNIVQIHEIGEAGGRPFIALEFVEGGSLAERLAGRSLPPRDAARLVATLAEAMHLAHSRNLVHRDLKPGNVLLAGPTGTPISQCQPKVTDFGLVRQTDCDSSQTKDGVVIGTPSYMAPEQADGRAHAAGPAADVYALGAILYECLTGRPPLKGDTPLETLMQVRSREPSAPSSLNPGVPRDLETICLKCLRKSPEQRYSSARELANDLERFIRGEPVAARPVGLVERFRKWVRRRPAAAALLAVLILLLSAGGVSLGMFVHQRSIARVRQALRDLDVRAIIREAQPILESGWQAQDQTRLTVAKIEADHAKGVTDDEDVSPEVRQEAETFQAHAALQLERARNNRQLMDAVLETATLEDLTLQRDYAQGWIDLDVDEQYTAAFRTWGLDFDRTSDAQAIERLSAEPDVVRQELTIALDSWMRWRLHHNPPLDWTRLYQIGDGLDSSEKGPRLRALLVERGKQRSERQGALKQIRDGIDAATERAPTIILLADLCKIEGDLAGAEQLLRTAVSARPDHAILIIRLARLLESRGPARIGEAIGYCRAARAVRPTMCFSLCVVLLGTRRYQELEEICREMLRREPNNEKFLVLLCSALQMQEKNRELETASLRLIELKPNASVAHNLLGIALLNQKQPIQAEKHLRQALARKPDSVPAHNDLGLALTDQGKFDEAEAAFRAAIQLDSHFSAAYVNLARLFLRIGRRYEALDIYRQALGIRKDALAYTGLGSALVNVLQDYEGAEAEYRKAIALQPDYAPANSGLEFVLWRQGKLTDAAEHARQFLRTQPEDVATTRKLCIALIALERFAEAHAAWRRMLDVHRAEPEAWQGYAESCLFGGDVADYHRGRTACLQRFAGAKDPAIAYKIARASLLLPASEAELQKASALIEVSVASRKPEDEGLRPFIAFTKGLLEYRCDRFDSAIALMQQDANTTWGPGPNLVVAMARLRQGRTQAARTSFADAVLAWDWTPARADDPEIWMYHVLRREAEAMILPNLPAFLEGTYQPREADERLAFLAAQLTTLERQGKRERAATLYRDLFAAEPRLAESFIMGNRYYGARQAVQAACGKGEGAAQTEKDRASWRRQALEWLRQDLRLWSKLVGERDPKMTDLTRDRLRSWQADYEFAGVRTSGSLARLPEEESQQWKAFWADVEALVQRAIAPK